LIFIFMVPFVGLGLLIGWGNGFFLHEAILRDSIMQLKRVHFDI
jgi:hypothetical protein